MNYIPYVYINALKDCSPVPGHPDIRISFGVSLLLRGGELKVRRCLIEACTDVSYLCKGVKCEDDLLSILDDGLNVNADEARHDMKRRVMARGIIVKTIAISRKQKTCLHFGCSLRVGVEEASLEAIKRTPLPYLHTLFANGVSNFKVLRYPSQLCILASPLARWHTSEGWVCPLFRVCPLFIKGN